MFGANPRASLATDDLGLLSAPPEADDERADLPEEDLQQEEDAQMVAE